MSGAKHTPGPWNCAYVVMGASEDDGGEGFLVWPSGVTSLEAVTQDGVIASIWHGEDGPNDETAQANAHLIAAAPDLLDAAQAAWRVLGPLAPTPETVEAAQKLCGAIAKAFNRDPLAIAPPGAKRAGS